VLIPNKSLYAQLHRAIRTCTHVGHHFPSDKFLVGCKMSFAYFAKHFLFSIHSLCNDLHSVNNSKTPDITEFGAVGKLPWRYGSKIGVYASAYQAFFIVRFRQQCFGNTIFWCINRTLPVGINICGEHAKNIPFFGLSFTPSDYVVQWNVLLFTLMTAHTHHSKVN